MKRIKVNKFKSFYKIIIGCFLISFLFVIGLMNSSKVDAANYNYANYGRIYNGGSAYVNLGSNWAFDVYSFVPSYTGTYKFYSSGSSGDPYGFLTTSGNYSTVVNSLANDGCRSSTAQNYSIAYDDDSNGNYNFKFYAYLNANTTYYFFLSKYSVSTTSYNAYISGYWNNSYSLNKQGGTGGTSAYFGGYYQNIGNKTNEYKYTLGSNSSSAAGTRYLSVPSKTGYIFNGYYTGTEGNGTKFVDSNGYINDNGRGTSSYTLYAYWTPIHYSIKYNANGGSGTMNNTSMTYGFTNYLVQNSFTKTGYTFAGWATSSNGSVVYGDRASLSNLTSIDGSVVNLYAKWNVNTYSVNFNANGGSGTTPSSMTFTYNSGRNLPTTTLTRTGYTFLGWAKSPSATSAQYLNGQLVSNIVTSGSVTLYAVWKANDVNILFNSQSATVDNTRNTIATYDSPMPSITIPTKTGYDFGGYYTQPNGTGIKYYKNNGTSETVCKLTSQTTLYALWQPITYNVAINLNGGTSTQALPTTGTYNQSLNLISPTMNDKVFRGWQIVNYNDNTATYSYVGIDNVSFSERYSTGPDTFGFEIIGESINLFNLQSQQGSTVNITAIWADDSFTVNFIDDDENTLSVEQTGDYNDVITIPTPTKQTNDEYSYVFKGWKCSADNLIYSDISTHKMGKYISNEIYNVTYQAVYDITYVKGITLTGTADTPVEKTLSANGEIILNPSDTNIEIKTKFAITTNEGVNSLVLLLDYDSTVFSIKANGIIVNGNVLGLGDATITNNYNSTGKTLIVLESETKSSLTGADFIEITYIMKEAKGGSYSFGFVTEYAETTEDLERINEMNNIAGSGSVNRSTAYAFGENHSQEQNEVKITVDNSAIKVIVRQNGVVTIVDQTVEYNSRNLKLAEDSMILTDDARNISNRITKLESSVYNYILFNYNGYGVENNSSSESPATTTIKWYTKNGDNYTEIAAPTNVGEYYIGVSVSQGVYYLAVAEVKAKVIITPYVLGYTGSDLSTNDKEYNGVHQTWATSDITLDSSYDTEHATISSVTGGGVNVGEYQLSVTLIADNNFTFVTTNGDSKSFNLSTNIIQATNTWTTVLSNDLNKTYDGIGINPLATAKFFADGETTYTYSLNGSEWTNVNPVNAGSYYVKAVVLETTNYTGLETIQQYQINRQIYKINDTTVNPTWITDNITFDSKVYNGEEQVWTISDINNWVDGIAKIRIETITGQDYINVGTPNLKIILDIVDINYIFDASLESINDTKGANITPFAITVTPTNQLVTYNTKEWTIDGVSNGVDPIIYENKIGQLYTLSVTTGTVPDFVYNDDLGIVISKGNDNEWINAGEYPLTATASNTNYTITVSTGHTFTIDKSSVPVPYVENFIYNGTSQKPTISSEKLYEYIVAEQTNAGTYNINVTLKDPDNYRWINVKENKTYEAGTYYIYDGSNYVLAYLASSFATNQQYYTYNGQEYAYVAVARTAEFDSNKTYYNYIDSAYVECVNLESFNENTDYYTYELVDIYNMVETNTPITIEASITLAWVISPANITVTLDNKTSQYKEELQALTSQVTNGTLYGEDNLHLNLSTTATNTSVVGNYPITSTYNNTNYTVTFVNGVYSITQKEISASSITVSTSNVKDYTGSLLTWNASEFTLNNNNDILNITLGSNEGFTNANINRSDTYYNTENKYYYNLVVSLNNPTNYKLIDNGDLGIASTNKQAEVKVRQATNNWTVTPSASLATAASELITAGNAKFKGNNEVSIQIYDNNECTTLHEGNYSANTTYYAKFTVIATNNYEGLSEVVSFTVGYSQAGKPVVTIDGKVSELVETIIYDAVEHKFVVPENAAYSITYTEGVWKNVNTYTAIITLDSNYKWSDGTYDSITYKLTIEKKLLSISIDNKSVMYSSVIPSYTVTTNEFATGESFTTYFASSESINDYIICEYTNTSNVGSYNINFKENAETDIESKLTNYDVTLTSGVLTVTSYIFTNESGTYQYQPIFENMSVEYDSESHNITVSGIIPSNLSISYKVNDNSFSGAENVGIYVITATFTVTGENASNFTTPNAITATLTITQLGITITAGNQTSVYNGNEPTVEQNTYSYSYTDNRVSDMAAFVSDELKPISLSKEAGVNVGNYHITITELSNGNYNITYVNGTYTITKAENSWTTVLWTLDDNGDIIYDGNDLVQNIDFDAVSLFGTPEFKFYNNSKNEISVPKNAGNYYITVSVQGTSNYTGLTAGFTDSSPSKVFEIQKYTFSMEGISFVDKTEIYNGAMQYITINGTLPTALEQSVSVSYSPDNGGRKDVGETTVTATFSVTDTTNFNIPSQMTAKLTITKKDITITATDKASQYNTAIVALTYTVTVGEIYNNEINPILSTTATSLSNVGNYPITIGVIDNNNYNITYVNGTYTITKFTGTSITSIVAKNRVYLEDLDITSSSNIGTVTYTYSKDGTTYGDLLSIQNGNGHYDVGAYSVKASVNGNDNYNGVEQVATFNITQATLSRLTFSYNHNKVSWFKVTTTTLGNTIDCTVTYKVNDNDIGSTTLFEAISTGSFTINAIPSDSSNYILSTTTTVNAYKAEIQDSVTDPVHDTASNLTTGFIYTFEGQTFVMPTAIPTTTGFTFGYWQIGSTQYTFNQVASAAHSNFVITPKWNINTYTIIWVVNGSTVETDLQVPYKSIPVYNGSTPTKDRTPEYSYAFESWSPVVAEVTQDATYTAVFTITANTYQITYYVSIDGAEYVVHQSGVNKVYNSSLDSPSLSTVTWFKADVWYQDSERTILAPTTMIAANLNLYGAYVFDIGNGDLNADGEVDTDDITQYRKQIVGGYDITVIPQGTEWTYVNTEGNTISGDNYYLERVADVNTDTIDDIRDVSTIRMSIVGGYGYSIYDGLNVTNEEVTDYYYTITEASSENSETIVSVSRQNISIGGNVNYKGENDASNTMVEIVIKAPLLTNGSVMDTNSSNVAINGIDNNYTITKNTDGYIVIQLSIARKEENYATIVVDWDGETALYNSITYTISTNNVNLD